MHIWKEVCYHMTTSFPGIRFFYDSFIISQEHLKRFKCRRHCVYFTTLVANIHYNKWPVTDSRKIEEYCVYLKKTIIALLFYRCLLFHRTSCINFCLISTVYILTGKLPSVRLPPLSENCPLWNCPTENCHTTNPAPWIWVRVWTKVRVRQEAVLRRAIFYVPC